MGVLAIIGPGDVKVDLADFDLKLQENLLSTLFFTNVYSCKNVFQIFFNFWCDPKKMMFWCTFWHIFVSSTATVPSWQPPPLAQFYCFYRPHEVAKSPAGLWSTVRHSASQNFNQFPVRGCVECGGWQVFSRPSLSLFLSALLVPHRSGHVPETDRLYCAVTHHTCSPPSWTGIFHLRTLHSLAIGLKVRSNFTSHSLWHALR